MGLTGKQRAFIAEYMKDRNGTQAAIRAGYSAKTAGSIAHENLTKPEIRRAIDEKLNALTMNANEAMKLLDEHSRGDLSQFMGLSVEELKEHPNSHLIKRLRVKTRQYKENDELVTEETIDIELHDPQAAVKEILKVRRIDNNQATEVNKVVFQTGMDMDDL